MASYSQVGFPYLGIFENLLPRSTQDNVPILEDESFVGYGKRVKNVLLNQENGDSLGVDSLYRLKDLFHQEGGQTEGGFI